MLGKRAVDGDQHTGAPPMKCARVEEKARQYDGISRYGPCTFYYFPSTYTWVVRCRNRRRGAAASTDFPVVIAHPKTADFHENQDILKVLGNPLPTLPNGTNVFRWPSETQHPGFHKMRNSILMDLYSALLFQRPPIQVGDSMGQNCILDTEDKVQSAIRFADTYRFDEDGNWFWAAWRDKQRFLKAQAPFVCDDVLERVLAPMIDWQTTAGYTGFWQTKLTVAVEKTSTTDQHIRVDCAHNPSFWAECYVAE